MVRMILHSDGMKRTETENKVQSRLIKDFEKKGFYVVKLILTNKNGIPDLLLLKNGQAKFVEVKRDGCKPRELQKYRMDELRRLGFEVEVMDG